MRLRHLFGTLSLLGIAAHRAPAQEATVPTPPMRLGITAGLNLADLRDDNAPDLSRRKGLMAGVSLIAPFQPTLAIQLEALYSMKGVMSSSGSSSSTLKMSYVELPVLLRWEMPESDMKPFLLIGPEVSYQVACDIDAVSGSSSQHVTCKDLEAFGFKVSKFDAGLVLGAGLGFDLGGRLVTVGVRYDHGLRELVPDSDPPKSKNRVLSLVGSLEWPRR